LGCADCCINATNGQMRTAGVVVGQDSRRVDGDFQWVVIVIDDAPGASTFYFH